MKRVLPIVLATVITVMATENNMAPSQLPPGDIAVEEAPMFVCFGWDDNRYTDGIYWSDSIMKGIKNPDGSDAKGTYFMIGSAAANDTAVLNSWKYLYTKGHEVGNHTWTHSEKLTSMDSLGWYNEIDSTSKLLTEKVGVPANEIYGFRTPRLAFSNATFQALKAHKFLYECTIQFGFDWWTLPGNDKGYSPSNPNTNKSLWWPMTMDYDWPAGTHNSADKLGRCPGMWEVMVYTVADPGESYDFTIADDPQTVDKVTGFDYNIFKEKSATGPEFARWMKYSLLQRLQGNRVPFTVNCHTDVFSQFNESANGPQGVFATKDFQERREGMEDFLTFASSFEEVYIVPYIDMINWMNDPKTLTEMAEGVSIESRPSVKREKTVSFTSLKSSELTLSVPRAGQFQITVHDMTGRMIHQSNHTLSKGKGIVNLPTHMAKGTYALTVTGNGINKSAIVTNR